MKTCSIRGRGFGLGVVCRDSAANACIGCLPRKTVTGRVLLQILGLSDCSSGGRPRPSNVCSFVRNIAILTSGKGVVFPDIRPFNSCLHGGVGGSTVTSGCMFRRLCSSALAITERVTRGGGFGLRKRCGTSSNTRVRLKTSGMTQNSIGMATNKTVLARGMSCAISCASNIMAVLGRDVVSTNAPIDISLRGRATCGVRHGAVVKLSLGCRFGPGLVMNTAVVRVSRVPLAAGAAVNSRTVGGAL